jgi:hypothetical protein
MPSRHETTRARTTKGPQGPDPRNSPRIPPRPVWPWPARHTLAPCAIRVFRRDTAIAMGYPGKSRNSPPKWPPCEQGKSFPQLTGIIAAGVACPPGAPSPPATAPAAAGGGCWGGCTGGAPGAAAGPSGRGGCCAGCSGPPGGGCCSCCAGVGACGAGGRGASARCPHDHRAWWRRDGDRCVSCGGCCCWGRVLSLCPGQRGHQTLHLA